MEKFFFSCGFYGYGSEIHEYTSTHKTIGRRGGGGGGKTEFKQLVNNREKIGREL